jgi:hypothetical protein
MSVSESKYVGGNIPSLSLSIYGRLLRMTAAAGRAIETLEPIDVGLLCDIRAVDCVKSVDEETVEGVCKPLGRLTNTPCLTSDILGLTFELKRLEAADPFGTIPLSALRTRDVRLMVVLYCGGKVAMICPFSFARAVF